MANPEHVAKLLEGVEAWNTWRQANPTIEPDLRAVDLNQDAVRDTALVCVKDPTGASFVDLCGTNFRKVNLSYANMQDALFENALFYKADLRFANIKSSSGWNADFRLSNLWSANLAGADLRGANFGRAKLAYAILSDAKLNAANFQGALLNGADLQGTQLFHTNLCLSNLVGANLERANIAGVKFDRSSRQRHFQGIRVSTCYGSQAFKSFAQDQDYIEELRDSSRWGWFKFWVWYISADCGRSFLRWASWSVAFALFFAYIYHWMGASHFKLDHLDFSFLAMTYYSVVTFTTLGFGDIKPLTETAAMVVMAEMILGYIMLGGLISIFANKVARRA